MAHVWAHLPELSASYLHFVGVFLRSAAGPQFIRFVFTVLGVAFGTLSVAWLWLKKPQRGPQPQLPPVSADSPTGQTRGLREIGANVLPESGRMATRNTNHAVEAGAAPAVVEPRWLMCPITNALFRDPVFVVDSGNTYDRDVLLDFWRTAGVAKDPLTNLQLATRDVRTNWAVRREVQSFLDEHPNYVPAGWDSRDLPAPDRPNSVQVPEPADADAEVNNDEGGLPAGARAHCEAVAAAHGGHIPEPLIAHFAAVFHVDREILQQAFGRHEEPPGGEAEAHAAELPAMVRAHCDHLARANGGSLPDAMLAHLSSVFHVDVAALRAAYPGAHAAPPEG